MYSMGACAILGMSNQDALSEDLECDPFLNSALQRFTCELCYRFGSFLSPLSIGLIMSRHYLSERGIKNGEMSRNDRHDKRTATPATPSKYKGLGSTAAAKLTTGFWFGIGVILAVRIVRNLDHCVETLMSSK